MAGIRSRQLLMITIAVCLCAMVTGVSLAVFSSPADRAGRTVGGSFSPVPASIPAAQLTAPAASRHGTTGPQGTADGIAKSALRWPPRLNHQIAAWKSGSGGAGLSAVTADLGNAMQAAAVRLYASMRHACKSLGSSIESAWKAPPIPDHAMQQLYAKALAGLSSAAADCRNAISTHPAGADAVDTQVNKVLLSRSRAELAAGSTELYTATAAIRGRRG